MAGISRRGVCGAVCEYRAIVLDGVAVGVDLEGGDPMSGWIAFHIVALGILWLVAQRHELTNKPERILFEVTAGLNIVGLLVQLLAVSQ
jgi:hypothetical protein